jgi:HK97 family phage major capsid protein
MSKTWNEFLRNLQFGQSEPQIPEELLEKMFNDLKKPSLFRQYGLVLKTYKRDLSLPCDNQCNYGLFWSDKVDQKLTNQWDTIKINTHTLQSPILISHDLLEDSDINVETIIYNRVVNRMNNEENQVFLYGDGEKQPLGLLNEKNNIKTIEVSKNNVSQLNLDDFINGYMQFNSNFRSNSIWIVNKKFMNFLFTFNKHDLCINIYNDSSESPINFLGRPLFVLDILHDNHLATLVDLGQAYCVVDRSEMNVLKDPY